MIALSALLFAAAGCDDSSEESAPVAEAPAKTTEPKPDVEKRREPPFGEQFGPPSAHYATRVSQPVLQGPRGPKAAYEQLKTLLLSGDRRGARKRLTEQSRKLLARMSDSQIERTFSGTPNKVESMGARAVVTLEDTNWVRHAVFFWRKKRWRYDVNASLKYRPWAPDPKVPQTQLISLEKALEGVEGEGTLVAELDTTNGTLFCRLLEDVAPLTVANFVGLARGKRPWMDPKTKEWRSGPFYDGLLFHRVIASFMLQGGDPTGSGSGGPGYAIPDELSLKVRHDVAGTLSMANSGPNTGGSQFFITEAPTPWLDDRHTVFGRCAPHTLIANMGRVHKRPGSDRPIVDIVFRSVKVYRMLVDEPIPSKLRRAPAPDVTQPPATTAPEPGGAPKKKTAP